MKLNLLTKGIILVSIPLCFEITLFRTLLAMQDELEKETQLVIRDKRINDSVKSTGQAEDHMLDDRSQIGRRQGTVTD